MSDPTPPSRADKQRKQGRDKAWMKWEEQRQTPKRKILQRSLFRNMDSSITLWSLKRRCLLPCSKNLATEGAWLNKARIIKARRRLRPLLILLMIHSNWIVPNMLKNTRFTPSIRKKWKKNILSYMHWSCSVSVQRARMRWRGQRIPSNEEESWPVDALVGNREDA